MKIFVLLTFLCLFSVQTLAFDFDNGNVIRAWLGVLIQIGRDQPVTLQVRNGAITGDALWEAWVPYTANSVGQFFGSSLRRPASEHTTKNKNIAMAYSYYRVSVSNYPENAKAYMAAFQNVFGLDPNDFSTDPATPIGIGNLAGMATTQFHYHNGMNQLGNGNGRMFNKLNYSDTTGYVPKNTPYKLKYPDFWQPNILAPPTCYLHRIHAQTYLMPQIAEVEPFGDIDVPEFIKQFPGPVRLHPCCRQSKKAYKKQAQVVIDAVADLDEVTKMKAEFFDNKLRVAMVAVALGGSTPGPVNPSIALVFNHVWFDSMIVSWAAKTKFDSVRPFSAIKYLFTGKNIRSWGGPGYGTVTMEGSEFASYVNTDAFPEYPSATTCLCRAMSRLGQLITGTDFLNYTVVVPKGSSVIEPGLLPTTNLTLHWNTWSEFSDDCGKSRVDSGVHFQKAVDDTIGVCEQIAIKGYQRFLELLDGTAD